MLQKWQMKTAWINCLIIILLGVRLGLQTLIIFIE